MCDEAANIITDCILPNAPVRQWVMSLPFELRALAGTKPDVLTVFGRIFASPPSASRASPVPFPQRFGGSLNLHVHLHLLAVDGVFEGNRSRAGSWSSVR